MVALVKGGFLKVLNQLQVLLFYGLAPKQAESLLYVVAEKIQLMNILSLILH